MITKWKIYREKLDEIIKPYLSKNIIIFGCNRNGFCLKYYLKDYYNIDVKGIIDLWERSPSSVVLHLYSFFYLYDRDDIIINVTEKDVIEEFEKCGERWKEVKYTKDHIVDILPLLFEKKKGTTIDYYGWLESYYKIDFTNNIRRACVEGNDAHGYYPTDFRVLSSIFREYSIGDNDAAFDFGCGKGALVAMLNQFGFKKVGGGGVHTQHFRGTYTEYETVVSTLL